VFGGYTNKYYSFNTTVQKALKKTLHQMIASIPWLWPDLNFFLITHQLAYTDHISKFSTMNFTNLCHTVLCYTFVLYTHILQHLF